MATIVNVTQTDRYNRSHFVFTSNCLSKGPLQLAIGDCLRSGSVTDETWYSVMLYSWCNRSNKGQTGVNDGTVRSDLATTK